jgi:ATP/maltotriose-dependent transcriptional regulator MalT
LRARVLASNGAALMLSGHYVESLRSCEEALEVARDVGSLEPQSQALNFAGVDLVNLGRLDEGLDRLRQSVRLAEQGEPGLSLLEAYNNLAFMLSRSGRPTEALAIATEGIERAGDLGLARISGTILRSTAADALYALGRWTESATLIREALDLDPQGEQAVSLAKDQGRLDVAQGRFAEAELNLSEAERLAQRARRTDSLPATYAAFAELRIWQGRPDDAAAVANLGLARLANTEETLSIAHLCALGIRAAADSAERSRSRRAADEAAEHERSGLALLQRVHAAYRSSVVETGSHASRAWYLSCEAESSRLTNAPDPTAWRQAVEAWTVSDNPYQAAYARMREAEARLAAKENRLVAQALLAAAHDVALRLGANPLRGAVEALARRARIDLTEVGGSDAPAGIDLGLTAREAEVLGLVANGMTNRQIAEALFITEKTAGVHMTNILGKLGVATRLDRESTPAEAVKRADNALGGR